MTKIKVSEKNIASVSLKINQTGKTKRRKKMFTEESTFEEILSYPGMAALEKFIMQQPVEGQEDMVDPAPEEMKKITLKMLASAVSPAWNPRSMAKGFNAIAAHLDADVPMKQEIYSSEEKKADPTKERTGLLWFPAEKKGPFALVCAGGAYMSVASLVEAFPVADRLNELGVTAFVLQYRAGVKGAAEKSGEDLRRALKFILDQREKFHVEEGYAAFGFSAGGHLVSELGTDNEGYKVYGLPKPQMLGLCYPLVAFAQEDEQMENCQNIMFEEGDREQMKEHFTPVEHLSRDYPKTFIWQTVEDEQVPFEANGHEIYRRLQKLGVPSKLKTVQHGLHGLGLGEDSEAAGWLDEAVEYWRS